MDFDALDASEQERSKEAWAPWRRVAEAVARPEEVGDADEFGEGDDRASALSLEVTAAMRCERQAHEVDDDAALGILVTVRIRDPSTKRTSAVFFCDAVNQALKRLHVIFAGPGFADEGRTAEAGRGGVAERVDALAYFLNLVVRCRFHACAAKHFERIANCFHSLGVLFGDWAAGARVARIAGPRVRHGLNTAAEHVRSLTALVRAADPQEQGREPYGATLERLIRETSLDAAVPAAKTATARFITDEVVEWRSRFGKIVKTSALVATRILHELRGRFVDDAFQEKYRQLRGRAKTGDAAHVQLLEMTWSVQREILPKYGYSATPAGLTEMRMDVGYTASHSLWEPPNPAQRESALLGFDMAVWKLRRDIHLLLEMGQPLPKMVVTRSMIEERLRITEEERQLRLRATSRVNYSADRFIASPAVFHYAQGDHKAWGRGYEHLVRALDLVREGPMPADVIAEARRGWMRIISMPDAEARRSFMQARCVGVLRERLPGLDVDFVDGVRSRDVAWRATPLGGHLSACSCGGEVVAHPYLWKRSCGQCDRHFPRATAYRCRRCKNMLCAACAGRGRASADWRGREVLFDMELWGPPTAGESGEMRERWERDQRLGPDAFENSFKYYNEGMDFTKEMSHGFVGSHLAHYDCWCSAVDASMDSIGFESDCFCSGPEWLVVAEDDAVPLPEFELDWGDVMALLCLEIAALRRSKTPWDLIWVGRGAAMGPEPHSWPEVGDDDAGRPSLLVRPGYCVLIHCYCLSRRGLQRLLGMPLSRTVLRPLDELFGSLNLGGRHLRRRFADRIAELGSESDLHDFRGLAFPFRGIVAQLEDTDEYWDSDIARSHQSERQQGDREGDA